MSDQPACLRAALWWISQSVPVVPLSPRLAPDRSGKLNPVPLIKWRTGPLLTENDVRAFWGKRPDAQLAILLGDGMGCVDVDRKHYVNGRTPGALDEPRPFPGGYTESTKSNGVHYLFLHRGGLPPGNNPRTTGLGGFVDVLLDGLLIVAPTRFENAGQPYEVIVTGSIPVFESVTLALQASAAWLSEAWRNRRSQSPPATATPVEVSATKDAAQVDAAVSRLSPEAFRVFRDGLRRPSGVVDRSLTEWVLVREMKTRGEAVEVVLGVVLRCSHAKSPTDRRGERYFLQNVWSRIPDPKTDERFGPWRRVGGGDAGPECGEWSGEYVGHGDPNDPAKVIVKPRRRQCKSPLCPKDARTGWAFRETTEAWRRLSHASERRREPPSRYVVTVDPVELLAGKLDSVTGYQRARRLLEGTVKSASNGGFPVMHRWGCPFEQSAHWCLGGYFSEGQGVRRVGDLDRAGVREMLEHASILTKRGEDGAYGKLCEQLRVVTWFGTLSYRRGGAGRRPKRPPECSVCGRTDCKESPLRYEWVGQGPPPGRGTYPAALFRAYALDFTASRRGERVEAEP